MNQPELPWHMDDEFLGPFCKAYTNAALDVPNLVLTLTDGDGNSYSIRKVQKDGSKDA